MKRWVRIALNLCIITSSMSAQTGKVAASLQKHVYLLGEHVEMGVSITNITAKTIPGIALGRTTVEIFKQNGQKLREGGLSNPHFQPISDYLSPNEDDYQVFDLNDYFGKSRVPFSFDYYFETGPYTVKVTSHSPEGAIDSADCTFSVVEPTGEDSLVYWTYIDIAMSEIKHQRTEAEVAAALQALHDAYPNSVYSPQIMVLLDAIYDVNLQQHAKAFAIRKECVEKYSWSVQGNGMLEGILNRMPSNTERIEYLKKIHDNSKNTILEKKYEKWIHTQSKK